VSTEPTNPSAAYDALHAGRNSRYGLILFAVYVVFYAGFVALNAFSQKLMAAEMPGGVNVGVAYGFGLIVLAFLLALVYMVLCRRRSGEESR
jgi:uncharacterized membrane protein (DUF485 family)